jgi:hypothetical protein
MSHQLWSPLIGHGISPNQIYFLDCCQSKIRPNNIINQDAEKIMCMTKGLINENCELTNLGARVLNEFQTYLVKRKKNVTQHVLGENSAERVNEYRDAWPKKRLPSGELARQSAQELKDKFVWFFKTYPEYSWDLILDATDYYNMVYEKKNYQYMVTSSYFIKKTNTMSKEVTSKLADTCQELLDNPNLLNDIR